jgi:hypothetical protein
VLSKGVRAAPVRRLRVETGVDRDPRQTNERVPQPGSVEGIRGGRASRFAMGGPDDDRYVANGTLAPRSVMKRGVNMTGEAGPNPALGADHMASEFLGANEPWPLATGFGRRVPGDVLVSLGQISKFGADDSHFDAGTLPPINLDPDDPAYAEVKATLRSRLNDLKDCSGASCVSAENG